MKRSRERIRQIEKIDRRKIEMLKYKQKDRENDERFSSFRRLFPILSGNKSEMLLPNTSKQGILIEGKGSVR
jgi:hypothetical protein